jgi:MYXO-CTERM domain-containing protein
MKEATMRGERWWMATAMIAGLAAGCAPPAGDGSTRVAGALGASRKLDILFMIDNSSSMDSSQANLKTNLPKFMDVFKNLSGGLPDLHIAVVTSDMGAGDGSITGCSRTGQGGVFQFGPGIGCTATNLDPGDTFISSPIGSTSNFTGDITAVFQCIATVGSAGCGFEHQLASVGRALGADGLGAAPQENQGFLRPDAMLAIVLVTNEDDCSAPVDDVLYDTNTNTNLASQVGPPGNFRCNEFGHLCTRGGGATLAPPLRLSPNPSDLTTTVTYDGCVSSETAGRLTPIATYVAGIKALKADPANQIVVASIQGPATPYVEHWSTAPIADTGPWPSITHSCDAGPVVGFADPGVRLHQFVGAFGANGLEFPICVADFGPALSTIAMKIAQPDGSTGTGGSGTGAGGTTGGAGGAGGTKGGAGGTGGGASGTKGGAGGTSAVTGGTSGGGGGTNGGAGGASAVAGGTSGGGGGTNGSAGGTGTGGRGTDAGGAAGMTGGGAATGRDGSADGALAPRSGGGCGCAAGGGTGATWPAPFLLVAAAFARRRRRAPRL